MTDDFSQLFGVVAIQRGLVTPEQLLNLLKQGDETVSLDRQLVRSGYLQASARLEMLSEVESLAESPTGDASSAIQSARRRSTDVDRFVSAYESMTRPTRRESPGSPPVVDDRAVSTSPGTATSQRGDSNSAASESQSADSLSREIQGGESQAASSDDSLAVTVISRESPILDHKDEFEGTRPSNPLGESLIYQAGDGLGADAGGDNSRDPGDGATVDYKPEYQSRYTLTRVSGEGGLGQVWQATDPALMREVALKRIRPGQDGSRDAQLRLIKEAQITGQLEHPNIIPVYELEQSDAKGLPFYTMKFLRGKTLHEKIKEYHRNRRQGKGGPLDLVGLLNAFIDVCNALAYAGSRGIVHRDLKPQNIMIGDFGEVLVLDWGLAKKYGTPDGNDALPEIDLSEELDGTETIHGGVLGTPAFMAPEQAAGRTNDVDTRTDVYGLGAVLFCILTGTAPHQGSRSNNRARDTMELLDRISKGDTPRPRDLDPTISRSLDAICAKAMSFAAKDRYQDARLLAADVQSFIADEPVSVVPEARLDHVMRWLRKNRAWTQSLATSAGVVLVATIAAAVAINEARKSEVTAHHETQAAKDAESRAKDDALKAQHEATDFFLASRRTIDTLFREVSDSLNEYPAVQRVRVKLLEEAATEYQRLAASRSEVPELKLEAARSLVRLGEVWRLLHNFDRARSSFEKARTQLTAIVGQSAELKDVSIELVTCLNGLGLTWATIAPLQAEDGQQTPLEQAERCYTEALTMVETLLSSDTETTDTARLFHRQLKARVLANQGSLLSKTDRLDDSLHCLIDAEAEFSVIAKGEGSPAARHEHAKSLVELSSILKLHGRNDDVKKRLNEAIQIYSRLVTSHPDDTGLLSGRADARLSLANVFSIDDEPTRRLIAYQECIDDYLLLIRSRPDVPLYRSNLVSAETNLAQVLYQQGETQTAAEHAYSALEQVLMLVGADSTSAHAHSLEVYVRVTNGQILRERADFTNAETAFSSALEKCIELTNAIPDDANLWRLRSETASNLGVLYLLTGQAGIAQQSLVEARSSFNRTLSISPDSTSAMNGHAWALTYLADSLRLLNRESEAADLYDEAIAARRVLTVGGQVPDLDSGEATVWLLTNCPDVTKRDPVAAMSLAEALLAKYPQSSRAHVLTAICHFRLANFALARSALDQARRFTSGHRSPGHFLRAMTLWKLNQTPEAIAAWKQAAGIMDAHTSGNLRLRRIREEASALLGDAAEILERRDTDQAERVFRSRLQGFASKPAPADRPLMAMQQPSTR